MGTETWVDHRKMGPHCHLVYSLPDDPPWAPSQRNVQCSWAPHVSWRFRKWSGSRLIKWMKSLKQCLREQYYNLRSTATKESYWAEKIPDLPNGMPRKTEGKRRRGWQRMRCLDGIIDSVHMNLGGLQEMAEDRKAWHAAVHRVTKSWIQLSDWTTTATIRCVVGFVLHYFFLNNDAISFTLETFYCYFG